MESLVSDIPAGDWKTANLLLQCGGYQALSKAMGTFGQV
jgi:hypothetical protein